MIQCRSVMMTPLSSYINPTSILCKSKKSNNVQNLLMYKRFMKYDSNQRSCGNLN